MSQTKDGPQVAVLFFTDRMSEKGGATNGKCDYYLVTIFEIKLGVKILEVKV